MQRYMLSVSNGYKNIEFKNCEFHTKCISYPRKWINNILKQYMLKGYVVDA